MLLPALTRTQRKLLFHFIERLKVDEWSGVGVCIGEKVRVLTGALN